MPFYWLSHSQLQKLHGLPSVLQLLSVERVNLYAASLRVCFLLFESMREHLKFQLEVSFLILEEKEKTKTQLYGIFSGASSVMLQG